MKIPVAAGVAMMLLLIGVESGAPQAGYPYPPAGISWADAKHRYGWVSTESARHRYCSRAGNVLCATDDGGKHWRPIFRGGDLLFSYLRWSKNAGVLSAGAKGHGELWTRDGGRHWWGTRAFQPGAYADAYGFGAGPRFSAARGKRQLRYAYSSRWPYRALGWVPRRPLTCSGTWTRWGGETVGPRNICGLGPVGGDGMSSRPAGPAVRLRVKVDSETGDGFVRSNAAGIDCGEITPWQQPLHRGTSCESLFGLGSTIDLWALTSTGATAQNVQWSGCSHVDPPSFPGWPSRCEITLERDAEVSAAFRRPFIAAAARGGNGVIAFVASRSQGGRPVGLAVIRPDGGGYRQLTHDRRDRSPGWSPDGKRLVFERGGAIFVMPLNGRGLRRLTPRGRGGRQPSWSPDGRELAFTRKGALYVMRADGSRQRLLYRHRGIAVNRPSWSPDGRRIAFGTASTPDAPETGPVDYGSIVVIPRRGGKIRYVTSGVGEPDEGAQPGQWAEDRGPDWSPDGKRITFTRRVWLCPRCDQDEIYSCKVDGSDVIAVSGSANATSSPSWSPDGKLVAANGLIIFTADGTVAGNPHRIGSAPAWQPR